MLKLRERKRYERWIIRGLIALLAFFLILFVFINRFIEPVLKKRLHTLIIQGSDSLYQYSLGKLDADFFGGHVYVDHLKIWVDSSRYKALASRQALPPLTFDVDLVRGHIRGVAVFPLVLGKRIHVQEILSRQANIRLTRHTRPHGVPRKNTPLWKLVQPVIKSITIKRINLDGIKLLYRNADTAASIKLQFDTCYALFKNLRIDSSSSSDPDRMAFAKEINIRFRDLKFRNPDSSYKLKAEQVNYSSEDRVFEVRGFKVQPTREDKNAFYAFAGSQKTMEVITFKKLLFTNFRLDQYINSDILSADTVFVQSPAFSLYKDKNHPPDYETKIASFPHQRLLKSSSLINIRGIVVSDASLEYTEKSDKTKREGTVSLTGVDMKVTNITNDPRLIRHNSRSTAQITGTILKSAPIRAQMVFDLDSANAGFDLNGYIGGIDASQLNAISEPLANARFSSLNINELHFSVRGSAYKSVGTVRLKYDNLYVQLQTTEDDGSVQTKKFITKILNKYTLHPSNPGIDGIERQSGEVPYFRPGSQSFFTFIWKTVFAGMQRVMLKTGQFD